MVIKSKLLASLMGPLSYVEVTSDDARLPILLASPLNTASLKVELAKRIMEGDVFDLEGIVCVFPIALLDEDCEKKVVSIAWAVGFGSEFDLALAS